MAGGDVCDGNIDGDAWFNYYDNCPYIKQDVLRDSDGDGAGDECDACDDPLANAIINRNNWTAYGCTYCADGPDNDGYWTNCDAYKYMINGPDCNDNIASIHPGAVELCNNVDDDCDGAADEGLGYLFYRDMDNDGYSTGLTTATCGTPPEGYRLASELNATLGDCADDDAAVHPGAAEVCNLIDDNCNGAVDEGYMTWYFPDQDNDGHSNEGQAERTCTPLPGFKPIWDLILPLGDCNDNDPNNWSSCASCSDRDWDGYFSGCDAFTTLAGPDCLDVDSDLGRAVHRGAAEVCNLQDDDCDGQVDNGVGLFQDLDGDGYGNPNVSICEPTGHGSVEGYVSNNLDCNDQTMAINPAANEVCNTVDDNCDGQVDEGEQSLFYKDADSDGYSDGTIEKNCSPPDMPPPGFKAPKDLIMFSGDCEDENAAMHPGAVEVCNGINDDCDMELDEGLGDAYYRDEDLDGYSDGTSITSCRAPTYGHWKLAQDLVSTSGDCNDLNAAMSPGANELCNGYDDNCNSQADENLVRACYNGDPLTRGIGACRDGVQACIDGAYGACTGEIKPVAELCDGLDNNCDGSTDNNILPFPAYNQRGVCAGSLMVCTGAGGWQEPNYALIPGYEAVEASCDSLDNDCDGTVDAGLVRPTTCGAGACAGNTGAEACVNGVWANNTCDPFEGAAPETCDNIDNDCNGTVDDGIAPVATACGTGECSGTGVLVCQAGAMIDTCTPGIPAPDDAICDGRDSDCDGLYDENYLSLPTTCGIGACLAAGSTSCVIGEVVNVCTPLPPAPNDAVCDGIDSDCDGTADEDYVATATACGIGACASAGLVVCQSGSTVNTCTPGIPTVEVCDGVDNNCNALTDEGFNRDGDMLADCFDTCPDDPNNDADADGICGNVDNCPMAANVDQSDVDGDGTGNACDACDNRPITGAVLASADTLWPPDHRMVPVAINASALATHNPDTQLGITTVGIAEYSRKASSATAGENIYDENNFEPDYAINGNLTVDLRSERAGASTGRTYTITVRAADCSGSYDFTTQVEVPHDQR